MSRGQRILKSEVGMRKWEKGKEHSAEGRGQRVSIVDFGLRIAD
jgi:hypothetical protein